MITGRASTRMIAAMLAIGLSGAAQATSYFQIDPNPAGRKLNLTAAKDAAFSTGSVISADDVGIAVVGNADFAHGYAGITPTVDHTLTSVLFTPTDPLAFSGFSFRGQTHFDNTTLNVMVQDQQGHAAETFQFLIPFAHTTFGRLGIIASLPGETIASVRVFTTDGFEIHDLDHMNFVLAPGTPSVPEPGIWALMIAGFGLVGVSMRRRQAPAISA
jgi:hypothetical protein